MNYKWLITLGFFTLALGLLVWHLDSPLLWICVGYWFRAAVTDTKATRTAIICPK